MTYDFVIVGGGSAGCVLANRLSADPSTRVLVLEAGRPDYRWDVFIHMPAALSFPIGSRFYDWKYESEPEPHMNGRRIYHARGKVLGGSSSINGMIFQRGNPLDFERWAAEPGMEHWAYAHCLPYFKRMETCLAGADEYRGGDGPLELERGPATNPLFGAFFEAVQQAGYELTDDVNGYRQEGFARFDRNIRRGRRLSARARLPAPGDERPNLEVRMPSVRRRGSSSTGRARSASRYVHATAGRRSITREARSSAAEARSTRRSCSSSRASATPRDLARARHPGRARPAGVGEHLQDHLEVYMQHRVHAAGVGAPALQEWRRPLDRRAVAPVQVGAGARRTTSSRAGSSARTTTVAYPNLMFHFLPIAIRYDGSHAGGRRTATRCTSGRCTRTRAAR